MARHGLQYRYCTSASSVRVELYYLSYSSLQCTRRNLPCKKGRMVELSLGEHCTGTNLQQERSDGEADPIVVTSSKRAFSIVKTFIFTIFHGILRHSCLHCCRTGRLLGWPKFCCEKIAS